MKINQTLYFTGVIGSFAGLVSWALGVWVPILLRPSPERAWMVELADSLLVGAVIGGLCAFLFERWAGQRPRLLLVLGALFGGGSLAALGGGLAMAWSRTEPAGALPYWLAPLLSWLTSGALLGLVLGALRGGFLPWRLLASMTGGSLGAAVGAAVHLLLGENLPFLSHAAGLMITGLGISWGSTLAVQMIRKAVLRLDVSSDPGVLSFFQGKVTEWEVLRGDSYTFGNAPSSAQRFIPLPDLEVASRHAVLREQGGGFVLEPHGENRHPDGEPLYPLSVERNGESMTPTGETGTHLEDGDLLRMGKAVFRFSLRGGGMIGAGLLLLALPAQAAPVRTDAQLAAAERGCLLEAGSEQPALRVALNLVDGKGSPLEIPIVDPDLIGKEPEVLDGDVRLHVLHAGAITTPPERYAILLIDVSGSMLGPAGDDGVSKFAHALAACRRFADDFVDGVDRIAVVPFASKGVEQGVERAVFHTSRRALQDDVNSIPFPERTANTGFFTAVQASVERLQRIGEERKRAGREAQLLLVAMTDGHNDVGNRGDDPGLLAGLGPVETLLDESGIPVITIGFGDPALLDEAALRRLARPSRANYLPAADPQELLAAFDNARHFQVERLSLTFVLKERFRSQLVRPHRFRVRLQLRHDQTVAGWLAWTPAGGRTAPAFECALQPDERKKLDERRDFKEWLWLYFVTLAMAGPVHWYLWFRLPKRVWSDQLDADVLHRRALSAVPSRRAR